MLIPARRRGFEHLDDPALPAAIAERLLRDVALANALFGGARAVLAEVRTVFEEARTAGVRELSLLDVGTGLADIPVAIAALGAEFGIRVTSIGLEHSVGMAQVARKRVATAVAADGRALPFGNDTVDIITCSLVLHHFEGDAALALLRACHVARLSFRTSGGAGRPSRCSGWCRFRSASIPSVVTTESRRYVAVLRRRSSMPRCVSQAREPRARARAWAGV
jgi:SAM-dependent methyltransferase